MTNPALRIERVRGSNASVRIAGRLGFGEVGAALPRASELIDAQQREILVDASGLEGVDSATLALLLAWCARARAGGTRLRFSAAPEGLRALAHLCDAEPLLGMTRHQS